MGLDEDAGVLLVDLAELFADSYGFVDFVFEMGGGGESADNVFRAMKAYLVGHDPARLEEMRFKIANPTASLYNNRTQILAALEFACLDILGQAWGVPVSEILGGRLRDRVPFASYCFFRYANPKDGSGERPARANGRRSGRLGAPGDNGRAGRRWGTCRFSACA